MPIPLDPLRLSRPDPNLTDCRPPRAKVSQSGSTRHSVVGTKQLVSRAPKAITEARVGDPIEMIQEQGRWYLKASSGRLLGRMSKNFSPLLIQPLSAEKSPPSFTGAKKMLTKPFITRLGATSGK